MFLFLASANNPPHGEGEAVSCAEARCILFLLFKECKGLRNVMQIKSWHQG